MTTKKIIVGVDFSAESELAARSAVEIARHTGGQVVLVHVAEPVDAVSPFADMPRTAPEAFEAYRGRRARMIAQHRDQLATLAERLSREGHAVLPILREGYADAALSDEATNLGADLVVVGTHGRTGLRWFFLGSVAAQVVRNGPGDVLIARREGAGRGGFHRILVGTDFSRASERALDRALGLAAPDAEVEVVHYDGTRWPGLAFTEAHLAAIPTSSRPIAREVAEVSRVEGEKLIAPRRRPDIDLTFHALGGTPSPGLVHRLEEGRYDLVALGSHGRRGFRLFTVGSLTETVVRRAPCSVLVARVDESKGETR